MRLNFKRLGLLAGKAARVFAAQAGLTPQRLDLLRLVGDRELSQRQIAERLCVSRPVVSRMLKALEELHLVVRFEAPEDKRIKLTRVTDEGHARLRLCFAPDAPRGAQAVGEAIWLGAWRKVLAERGLRVDSILRARPPHDYAALAQWNQRYVAPAHAIIAPQPPPGPDPILVATLRELGIDPHAFFRGDHVRAHDGGPS